MRYEVHFGVELPFWLALPAEEFSVVLDGAKHRVKTSNEVVRMDVGDFYRRPDGYLVVWEDENKRETRLRELENQHPELRPFQRKAKTVVTHIRDVDAADDAAVQSIYRDHAERWTKESIAVVNRFIDWYRIAVSVPERRREVTNVSEWDLTAAIVSFWNVTAEPTQVGGTIQPLTKVASSPPPPISAQELDTFRDVLKRGDQPPVIDSLLYAAGSLIPRGVYRNVVVDAVTALEVAAEEAVRRLGEKAGLSADIIDLLGKSRFDELCKRVVPALGGPHFPSKNNDPWKRVCDIRDKRNDIVHRAESADEEDALEAVDVCTQAARMLAENP